MAVPVRDWTHWALGYAPSRVVLSLLARGHDPLAKLLTIETHPVDDIYPLIEQIRQRGRMSPVTSPVDLGENQPGCAESDRATGDVGQRSA